MSGELDELYQEVILDHSRRPRNFGEMADARAVRVHGDNPSCGDEIYLAVRFGEDGSLGDIRFTGQGCAISRASASLMTMKSKGKSRVEVRELLDAFGTLITTGTGGEGTQLGDLRVMAGVTKFPQRVKCAMLAWRALEQALEENAADAKVSTESGFHNTSGSGVD